LDLLILKILALEPPHGWAISQRLKQVSGEVLQVSDGSLYPALHKLEQEGWITAEWKRVTLTGAPGAGSRRFHRPPDRRDDSPDRRLCRRAQDCQ
jgi:hypothetical protein